MHFKVMAALEALLPWMTLKHTNLHELVKGHYKALSGKHSTTIRFKGFITGIDPMPIGDDKCIWGAIVELPSQSISRRQLDQLNQLMPKVEALVNALNDELGEKNEQVA